MPSIAAILLYLALAYALTFPARLLYNFAIARRTGFPFIFIPWDQNHPVWMIISVPLRAALQRHLPRFLFNKLTMTIYGWEFHEGLRPYKQYIGDAKSFVFVTFGRFEFNTRDPEISLQILNRPRDFQAMDLVQLFMNRFGANILTANGEQWQRHRKIVAAVINERISKAVFTESVRQASSLVDLLSRKSSDPQKAETSQLFDMLKTVTVHVLSGAGMGTTVPFDNAEAEKPKKGYKLSYIDAVKVIINAVAGPIALPQWFLVAYPTFLPGQKYLKELSVAVDEFPVHTKDMLDIERQRAVVSKDGGSRNNIMSQLLQASERSDSKGPSLTEDEMMGNLFIFTAAGFETTAGTLSYAVVLMARYPEWQDWMIEELDSILPEGLTDEQLEYNAVFPKAIRIQAFLMETVRLFPPVIHLAKQTIAPQTLQTSKGTFWLPSRTSVYINTVGVGLDPDVYRNVNLADKDSSSDKDEARFRPTRWINPPGSTQPLFQPPKGSFLCWGGGPRVCPGMKMAQVEFTAVLLVLLRRYRLEAVPLKGESKIQQQQRLDERMKHSTSIMTLQMDGVFDVGQDSDKGVRLRLVKRT